MRQRSPRQFIYHRHASSQPDQRQQARRLPGRPQQDQRPTPLPGRFPGHHQAGQARGITELQAIEVHADIWRIHLIKNGMQMVGKV